MRTWPSCRPRPTTPILVTEQAGGTGADWRPQLEHLIRASVHATRNTLNGVLVNLEVVRSRLARRVDSGAVAETMEGSAEEVLSFAKQAVLEAEAAASLHEGIGALLLLIAASVDSNGSVRCFATGGVSPALTFDVDDANAERLLPRLQPLGQWAGFAAERHDGAVILRFPLTSRDVSLIHA